MGPAVIDLVWKVDGIHCCINILHMDFYRDIVVKLLVFPG